MAPFIKDLAQFKTSLLPSTILLLMHLVFVISIQAHAGDNSKKQSVNALYIPLADHYAAIVAYERYRKKMKFADYKINQMKNWDLLRAYFQTGDVDMAFVMSPLAMDMYYEKPDFRWIGLMHRDGNAMAINELLNQEVHVLPLRRDRKPDKKVADALKKMYSMNSRKTEIGMPHLLSTHTVVLYQYLKENGVRLSLKPNQDGEVLAIPIAPPKSPAFIKSKSNRATPAAFQQSLPWADVVETGGYGHVAWYSKDVIRNQHGHVECIAIASNKSIAGKTKAIKEVMHYIHRAGQDIEKARNQGGKALKKIVTLIRKHIPAHTAEAITASLDPDLRVINYERLNIDKAGLKQIMDLAVEGGILKDSIDIEAFADSQFEFKAE